MKVTITFEFDDGAERSYVFHKVETPDESSSTHRTQFKVEPHYNRVEPATWPPDLSLIPPLVGASVGLSFYAQPDYERGEVYRLTERKTPPVMTSTMCWACGDMRGVTSEGVFVEHGVNHDGSGEKCRGSGTDGPPEMAKCGYCGRTIPLRFSGRFESHLRMVTIGAAGGECQGSGCAPEETTG